MGVSVNRLTLLRVWPLERDGDTATCDETIAQAATMHRGMGITCRPEQVVACFGARKGSKRLGRSGSLRPSLSVDDAPFDQRQSAVTGAEGLLS